MASPVNSSEKENKRKKKKRQIVLHQTEKFWDNEGNYQQNRKTTYHLG